jgi:hypothetical protein
MELRGDMAAVVGHISTQLEECRRLRDSDAVAQLMEDDAQLRDAKACRRRCRTVAQ